MSSLNLGPVGLSTSDKQSPVYELPYGTVQLASHLKDESGNFDLSNSFSVPIDFENNEEEDEEEDDEVDSEDAGKGKGGKKGKKSRSEAKGERDTKTGRRKIKIEFIEDDARRHITFSKRKAGIMKKAYELATLTGTQVLLLVVSQTGLVYTFTTPKLQALVTQAEGRNLIQACLNSPDSPPLPGDSGAEDRSVEEASEGDDGASPSTSQGGGKKRPASSQGKKRSRVDTISKPNSASLPDDEATPVTLGKRGRGRPRKSTVGSASSFNETSAAVSSAPTTADGLAPPPPLHQRYSADSVPLLQQHHLHHQQQQQQQHHQQQQQQQQQQTAYGHVNPSDFGAYGAPNNYYAGPGMSGPGHAPEMNFAHQPSIPNSLSVDAAHATWNPSLSPQTNTQTMFADGQHQPNFAAFAQQQQQHYPHFNPQQMASMQPQEIQTPRPAW